VPLPRLYQDDAGSGNTRAAEIENSLPPTARSITCALAILPFRPPCRTSERPRYVTEDLAMIDLAKARRMMVDGQVRPSDMTDHAVIAAMGEVPRERFVPDDLAAVAYLDRDVPVDPKRSLLKPMVIARMVQALELKDGSKVLDVAGGTGYTAAILARLAGSVVALEDDAARTKRCGELAREFGATNVTAVSGPLDAGWPALAPYDAIIVNGACEVEPQTLLRQLGDGGRLAVIFGTAPATKAMLYRVDNGEIGYRPLFNAAAPLLPVFAKVSAFTF
jgi:protein-L-isoaspartate(D-aspartate) O-methyltransferase